MPKYQDFAAALAVADELTEVWRTPEGEAYVTVGDTRQDIAVESKQFGTWLRYQCRARGIMPVRRATVTLVADHLVSVAAFEAPQLDVAVRVAHLDGNVYIDLGTDEVVEIAPGSWREVPCSDVSVRFRRSATARPLPRAVRGGDIRLMRECVNVDGDEEFLLLVGFVLGCYSPGPFPVLCLEGGQGRGKSMTTDMIRAVVDPDDAGRLAKPKNSEDVMVAARNRRLLGYDNLSGIADWLSDLVALLSTGGGLSTRRHHTNMDEALFTKRAPVVLNGIDELAVRGDLASRSITLELPRILARRTEAELLETRKAAAPHVLGAIFDAVAFGLENPITGSSQERMADHVAWVEAAIPRLGWVAGTYERAFVRMQRRLQRAEVSRDAFAGAVAELVRQEGRFVGTSAEVLRKLDDDQWAAASVRRSRGWPKSPQAVGVHLRRTAAALERVGVVAEQGDGRGRRIWTLEALTRPANP